MKKLKSILLYSLLLVGCIYIVFTNMNGNVQSKYDINTTYIQGKILDYKINGDTLQLEIKAKEKVIVFYHISSEEEKLYLEKSIQYGDIYKFYGKLEKPSSNTNFHLFSYKNYLCSKKIYYVMNVNSLELYKKTNSLFYKCKNYLYQYVKKNNHQDYLYTFVFGNTEYLNDSILSKYRSCGISHLIAISGMHIGLLSMVLIKLLRKVSSVLRYNIVFFFLFFYAFLVGFTPSVTRAVVSFVLISCFQNKVSAKRILLSLMFLSLLYNPFIIYNTGFLFSYIISFFLIISNSLLQNCKNYFKKILIISWIAFLAGIPILSISYFEVNLLSPFLNLIFVPLISFLVFPLAVISFIFPFLNPLFSISIQILEIILYFCDKYLVWNWIIPYMNIYIILGYWMILYIVLYCKKIKYTIFFLLFILILSYLQKFNPSIIITMIDVGQGDSILIQESYSHCNILIDTGGKVSYKTENWKSKSTKSIATQILGPYLKSIGIHSLDYLILSHGDYDHMGEAMNLVNNFKVENVIFNNDSYNELEQELIKVLDKKKIKYYKGLKELNIANDKLYFLNTKEYDNENDNSNVLYFKMNNYKFLFMGDAGVEREKDILEKYNLTDIDFIKIGHHGSNTSSSKEFIDNIKPKNCLISVGKNNRYGHPKESVIDILDNYCDIYRTDLNGSIEIKINKNNYKIKTYSS